MLKTISKALCVLTLAGLMLWSPLPSAQAANTSFYYISAETDYNANEPIYVVGHKEPDTATVCSALAYASLLQAAQNWWSAADRCPCVWCQRYRPCNHSEPILQD